MRRQVEERASGESPIHLRPRRQPVQARARRRLEQILDATVALLSEGGADAVTTRSIAARARVPIGSVYHYFPSKEAVLVELAGQKFSAVDDAFVADLERSLERLPWRRAVERAVDASVSAFRSDPAYVSVWRAMRAAPGFRSVAAASDERFARALAALPLVARLPAPRALEAMRVAVRIANTFLDWVLEKQEPREAAAVVREMKHALVAYLASDLDEAVREARRPQRRSTRLQR